MDGLEERLNVIRSHVKSKLENQQLPALVLTTIDKSIKKTKQKPGPEVYMTALVALVQQDAFSDEKLQYSVVYLLSMILPETKSASRVPLCKSLLPILEGLTKTANQNAPVVRCAISCHASLVEAAVMEQSEGNKELVENSVEFLFLFTIDARPKIRKRAVECLQGLLQRDERIGITIARVFVRKLLNMLDEAGKKNSQSEKSKDAGQSSTDSDGSKAYTDILHVFQLLNSLLHLSQMEAQELGTLILAVVRFVDANVVQNGYVYKSLAEFLENAVEERVDALSDTQLSELVKELLQKWDILPGPAAFALAALTQRLPNQGLKQLDLLIEQLIHALTQTNTNKPSVMGEKGTEVAEERKPGTQLTSPYEHSSVVFVDRLQAAFGKKSVAPTLSGKAATLINRKFLQNAANTGPYAFACVCAFLRKLLRFATPEHEKEYCILLTNLHSFLTRKELSMQKSVHDLVGAFIQTFHTRSLVEAFRLSSKGELSRLEKTKWFVQVMQKNVQCDELNVYKSIFFPAAMNGSKAWWSLLPAYCKEPTDAENAIDEDFVRNLAGALIQQKVSRQPILSALELLVENNAQAQKALLPFAENIMGTLGNLVFELSEDVVLQQKTLHTLCSIYRVAEPIQESFITTIIQHLRTFLTSTKRQENDEKQAKVAATMLPQLLRYAPDQTWRPLSELLAVLLTDEGMQSIDFLKQNRFLYRLLKAALLNERMSKKLQPRISSFCQGLVELPVNVVSQDPSTALERMSTWRLLLELLPENDLHVLPPIIEEIILTSKHEEEEVREEAYGLLIQMGEKCKQGGRIEQSRIDGLGEDAPSVDATLDEFLMMMVAILVDPTAQHAPVAITALSRIVYEFREDIGSDMLNTLFETVETYLGGKHHESARSSIGFVKMFVTSFPASALEARLNTLMPMLFRWLKEHNAYVKLKAKQLVDRMIRVFGVQKLGQFTEDEDDKKWLNKVNSVREARGKKQSTKDEDEEMQEAESDGETKFTAQKAQRFKSNSTNTQRSSQHSSQGSTRRFTQRPTQRPSRTTSFDSSSNMKKRRNDDTHKSGRGGAKMRRKGR
ncbi:rRNA processing protein Rrp12-like protein [Schizosaccharomyces japonicus yFS275]|uniref:rRNA processing protein Rrp12-like protein n=1 Tax=Schizosaccharomyces japonicus (strain yFS275 / FY16936) TaxID=402676 RepID=B6K7H5_SCHJY|nr:rRNA processing protein Rrp12-like protein [Schizosaccharomyces japonicus yFS275]EEB09479.1 rRNA processing protein Rrp12-like protein [Schizosaccharomyces japonicus yFS275]